MEFSCNIFNILSIGFRTRSKRRLWGRFRLIIILMSNLSQKCNGTQQFLKKVEFTPALVSTQYIWPKTFIEYSNEIPLSVVKLKMALSFK